jgi:hypothetical protein
MARDQVHAPKLPPSNAEIGAFLVLWAVNRKVGRFCMAKAVTREPLLRDYIGLSETEYRELCLRMGKFCYLVYPVMYTNEYV